MARNTEKLKRMLPFVVCCSLAAVFLYAGASKALDPASFAAALDNYRLLPHVGVIVAAIYLPWLEIVVGLGLLWPRTRAGALTVLSTLATSFTLAIGSALARGLDIDCGCFGMNHNTTQHGGMVFSMFRSALIMLTSVCLWRLECNHATEPPSMVGTAPVALEPRQL